MSQYFPKPYGSFGGDIDVEDDLSNNKDLCNKDWFKKYITYRC